jgi:CysZ protein
VDREGRDVTFFDGIKALFGGVGFIVATPRTWPRSMVPMAMAVVLTVVVGALGVLGGVAAANAIIPESDWAWVLKIVFGIAAVLLGVLAAITFAQPLSGWALDGIVREQDRAMGQPELPDQPFARQLLMSLCVTFAGLFVSVIIIGLLSIIEMIFAPAAFVCVPLKFVIGAMLIAWDFVDYPMSLREVGVRDRIAWMFANFWFVLGFGLTAALILMIPCIGLFILPMGVAGAARMVVLAPPNRSPA